MKNSSKRIYSRVLAFIMLVSAMFTNVIVTSANTDSMLDDEIISGSGVDFIAESEKIGGGAIDVWDFGGVAESDTSLYNNNIDTAFLDGFTAVGDAASGNKGKFLATGTSDLGGGLTVTANANDRLFYNGDDGLRSYGSNAKATNAYDDGYTANGMWYANGTGGETRRYFQFDNVVAGTAIKLYTGSSNSTQSMIDFTYLGSETQAEEIVLEGGVMAPVEFVAKYDGSYKVWFNAAGGKPVVNRIVKTAPVPVTLNLNSNSFGISSCDIKISNDTTKEEILTTSGATVNLTPNYSYTATATGVVGYGFTNSTKRIDVTLDDLLSGSKVVNLEIEPKSTYKASGKLIGFDSNYDTSKLTLTMTPPADSLADAVVATVNSDLTFEATLEPDVKYTAVLSGVNDYEVVAGGTFESSTAITQDVEVALKARYAVSGTLKGLPTALAPIELTFVNIEDNYAYKTYSELTVDNTKYGIKLRDGSYEVVAVVDGYKTSAHVIVNGKDMTEDILFVQNPAVPPVVDTAVKDLYVGVEGMVNNYSTVKEAVAAAAVIAPKSEADRVTIHIAPGTYREQIIIETPYITLKPEGNGEVKLSWYYGIGYRYYSVDSTGYYNVENADDKFSKEIEPAKWGVGTYVKKTATNFKAENITFEASFNKYITDEEIADGVSQTGSLPERNYSTDATSRAATERSTALIIEADMAELKNCDFIGSQDTLYMGDGTHTYYNNCNIEGNTDYIFGSGNAVFDACELRFCGYSDTAMGGYITAGRSNKVEGYKGYIFRDCVISAKEGMKHAGGYFGRPWDAGSDITFVNTVFENSDAITPEGWTSMSGVAPTDANFKEFNSMLADGTPVDNSKRVTGNIDEVTAMALYKDAKTTYLGWEPTYYVEPSAVAFEIEPYFSTDGDVLLPATGDTFIVKYSLGANDANDVSKISYVLVSADGTEKVIKQTTAAANNGVLLTTDMIGSKLKVTVTPAVIGGFTGEPKTIETVKEITLGSGSVVTPRPSGKVVIFLAGDSTVKDYSAGAINNSGATRPEGSWGEFIGNFVNGDYEVMNYAQGGRSTRTFYNGTNDNDKYFDIINEQMMSGDYLFIQFGHNDSSADYADRYVPVGTPDASGKYPYTPQVDTSNEGSGSFCWYLQQMIDACKAKGVTPVLVTPVSRMYYNTDGTIRPHHGPNDEYVAATKQVAEDNGILCFDLYNVTKKIYEDAYKADGANGVSENGNRFFAPGEKTHHSKLGGFAIAADLAKLIKDSTLGFANAIVAPKSMHIVDDKNNTEFSVNNSGLFVGAGINSAGEKDPSISTPYWDKYINGVLNSINADVGPTETTEATTEITTIATTETTTEATTEITTIATTEATTETTTIATTESTSQATTEAVTEESTEATTVATTVTTEATTVATTEVTTTAPRRGGGGGGSRFVKTTTQATTETTTEATTEEATAEEPTAEEPTEATTAPILEQYVEVAIGDENIVIGDKSYTMDVAPYIQTTSNSTMVPLRFVSVAIAGGDVEKADQSSIVAWDGVNKTATITYGDVNAVFTADSNIVVINGVSTPMDNGVKAEIKDNRMFVPFRVVGSIFGASVDWDGADKTAYYNK